MIEIKFEHCKSEYASSLLARDNLNIKLSTPTDTLHQSNHLNPSTLTHSFYCQLVHCITQPQINSCTPHNTLQNLVVAFSVSFIQFKRIIQLHLSISEVTNPRIINHLQTLKFSQIGHENSLTTVKIQLTAFIQLTESCCEPSC